MWGNQLSDNYNTSTEIVNERKKTKFVKRLAQRDYLNRIEMKKMNQWTCLSRTKDVKVSFFVNEPINIEVKTQNLLHRKQTNLGPLRKLYHFIGLFRA